LACLITHHKLLLVASHTGAPLGVLVSPDEQLDQAGNGSLLPQSTVVGWAKRQVADQTNCSLDMGEISNLVELIGIKSRHSMMSGYEMFIQQNVLGKMCRCGGIEMANDLD